ncbi:MAG: ethanolamine utilization protein EutH [Clostridia bacterium]|nr:ethanolamine utilization protein EutH [Clostridia bacterium]
MNILSFVMAFFALLGALDRLFGSRFGIGKEFERGLHIFGALALSMIGMIIISPAIEKLLSGTFDAFYRYLHIDPSVITASLFANDMGGTELSLRVAKDAEIGSFNGLVMSSMMGCTVSFTIPNALGMVDSSKHKPLLTGLLCGIVTIPIGSFFAGLVCGIPILPLLLNLAPLALFSIVIALGLFFFRDICVKIFDIFGKLIKIIITVGLALGILRFLTGFELVKGLNTLEYGADICLSIAAFMTGALPMLFILSKVFAKPLGCFGKRLGINEISSFGLVSTLATSITTFEKMGEMDDRGVIINSAFAVPAAFVLADHLAFTLSFDPSYVVSMMSGKIIAGILAIILALVICGKRKRDSK